MPLSGAGLCSSAVEVWEPGSTVLKVVSVFDDPLVRERVPWWESASESERRAVYDALRFISRDPTATRCAGPLLAHHRSIGFGKPVLTCDACNLDDRTHAHFFPEDLRLTFERCADRVGRCPTCFPDWPA